MKVFKDRGQCPQTVINNNNKGTQSFKNVHSSNIKANVLSTNENIMINMS